MTCYGQIVWADRGQEWYCTKSRDAGRRARQLRKAGYRVVTAPMGHQVTSVGRVQMTLLNWYGPAEGLPTVPTVTL